MSKKKGIAVAVVVLLVLLIGGMLAYFTDTDVESNVFTIGDAIDIDVIEDWTPNDGLKVHPGVTVTKKPSVKNLSTTPAYVFLKITVPCYKSNPTSGNVDTELFTFTAKAGWEKINESSIDQTSKTKTYVYAYSSNSTMTSLAANTTTGTIFDSVTVSETLTLDQAATLPTNPNIDIKGYGIQVDGLGDNDTPAEIFALFGNN